MGLMAKTNKHLSLAVMLKHMVVIKITVMQLMMEEL